MHLIKTKAACITYTQQSCVGVLCAYVIRISLWWVYLVFICFCYIFPQNLEYFYFCSEIKPLLKISEVKVLSL